jgi:NADH:ubiquinone oxidoreductase subunit 5 (subunit L)/multisubunit Na+/H+ antiporter MnhA subunit
MLIPLVVLAVLSVGSAWGGWFQKLVVKPSLATYATAEPGGAGAGLHLQEGEGAPSHEAARAEGAGEEAGREELALEHRAETIAMPLSILIAGLGILLSWLTYLKGRISAEAVRRRFAGVHALLAHKYYIDEIYLAGLVRPVVQLARGLAVFDNRVIDGLVNGTAAMGRLLSWFIGLFDNKVVDGAVNGVAWTMLGWGRQMRRVQTGKVQNYVLGLFAVALVLIIVRLMQRF